jgi:hypothetical protein
MVSLVVLAMCGAGLQGCAQESSSDVPDEGESALISSTPRAFRTEEARGSAKRQFPVAGGVVEICAVPKHWDEESFTDGDRKKEAKLCTIDFNASPGTDGTLAAALAPKNNSTNPATDVHQVDADHSRESIESKEQAFKLNRDAKKLGKFKQSLSSKFEATATYAPSISGYYQTSRMLGKVGEVAPAVLRTLDVKRHAKVAELGAQMPLPVSRIVKNLWATFRDQDRGTARDPLTYTVDGGQLYGALVAGTSDDAKDKSIDTEAGIKASKQYANLMNARPVSQLVTGATLKDAVGTIVPMQGLTEMLILDTIMLQADRLSGDNVSYVNYVYFKKADGSIDKDQEGDMKPEDLAAHPEAAKVKKLYLNDVDAGLAFKTTERALAGNQFAMLGRIAHISPDLYTRLMKLSKLTDDAAFEAFVRSEWLYTDRDWFRYKTMVQADAKLLHDRCVAKQLTLDLDLDKQLSGTNLKAGEGCE